MVVAQVIIAAPLVTGFTVAALASLPSRLRLQLYALGASRPQALWLLLREARLPLLAAVMAGFGAAISEIGASQMVGGNLAGETRVLTTAVVLDVSRGDFSSAHSSLPHSNGSDLLGEPSSYRCAAEREDVMISKVALRGVAIRHSGVEVLRVPELDVREGEVLAVLGANGAGKSTLLQTLALLERPTEGSVLLDGLPVLGRELSLRRKMAMVFQESMLLDRSVEANVALGLSLRGVGRKSRAAKVARWLNRLGIGALAKRSGRTLSGGEAQRTALARAFVLEPEVLFLDEPFSSLDQPTRESLLEELVRILDETMVTTVLVTHDRREAIQLAHRIGVMAEGRLLQLGNSVGTPQCSRK